MKKYSILLIGVLILCGGCLPSDLLDEAEDNGFGLVIINHTENEYIGFVYYIGALKENGEFIATDSLVFKDTKIPKKSEGINECTKGVSSCTYPLKIGNPKLNKYGHWAPDFEKIKIISKSEIKTFKFKLSNGKSLTDSSTGRNGTKHIHLR
jgi:hypothetical protein